MVGGLAMLCSALLGLRPSLGPPPSDWGPTPPPFGPSLDRSQTPHPSRFALSSRGSPADAPNNAVSAELVKPVDAPPLSAVTVFIEPMHLAPSIPTYVQYVHGATETYADEADESADARLPALVPHSRHTPLIAPIPVWELSQPSSNDVLIH